MRHDGPETLKRIHPVSRETVARLETLVVLLRKWQRSHNLVAASTLETIWTRHIADSLQLLALAPATGGWVDLGSGGGFPGLVIAIAGERPVTLIESNGKKAAFLREAGRACGATVDVRHARIEEALPTIHRESVAVISARALANLTELCGFAAPFVKAGAIALFPKGQDVDAELTEATRYWSIDFEKRPSHTDPTASVLIIRGIDSAA
jgi:16S rRNA (guanine527-N7)-methyltransferase